MATTSSITDEPIRTTNDSDLLNSYIVPLYDILHTQSKQYIVDDIIEVMKSRGIDI